MKEPNMTPATRPCGRCGAMIVVPNAAQPTTQPPPLPPLTAWPTEPVEAGCATDEIMRHAEVGRVEDIRAQIAAGTYVTDEKLDYVVDRLWEHMSREGVFAGSR
jgi:hypothetical protein